MALKRLTKEELQEILDKHTKWLAGAHGGERANLSSADLRWANLSSANLSSADLRSANLSSADLRSANLRWANLRSADLSSADLRETNLSSADLSSADLRWANLSSADLRSANLRWATGGELAIAVTRVVPAEGSIIGWKKCQNNVLVKVLVPTDAKRSNAFGRKCRAEFVDVLGVFGADVGISQHDGKTTYRVGERVQADQWCEDYTQECAGGIHFFITQEEAAAYIY